MSKRKIVVGSRDSKLAVLQTKLVMKAIEEANPQIELELVTMKTTGDLILDRTLDKVGGKGLFVKELDRALIDKKVDITVHSLKDMPMEVSEELPLLAFFKRGNPFDTLVLRKDDKYKIDNEEEFKNFLVNTNLPIGTSSLRRRLQLKKLDKDIKTKPVRGNVITRLKKLDEEEFSSLILAGAGLERLNLEDRISFEISPDLMIPSAGQGILVVQGRKGEDYKFLEAIDCEESRFEGEIERCFVAKLQGGCSSPVAAYCKADLDREKFSLHGFYGLEDMSDFREGSIEIDFNGDRQFAFEKAEEFALSLREKLENGR